MSIMKYALPALAVASSAMAQNCATPTQVVQNAGDASALGACPTFTGDISISSDTTDNLDFGNLGAVKGDFTALNATNMVQITANSLESISGDFHLEALIVLTTLNFPKLTSVNNMELITLPALQGLNFAAGIQEANDVQISDTELTTLEGINLMTVNSLQITENRFLTEIDVQLKHINTSMFVSGNGNNVSVSLPNLENAFNLTFINISAIDFPSLQSTNGSISFQGSSMETVSAPNITYINQTLSLSDNSALNNVSMPQLIQIGGGFTMARNPDFIKLNAFPDLKTVRGAVDVNGNFTTVELPALNDVEGAFNVQSTGDITNDCSTFSNIAGPSKAIKGKFECQGSLTRPGGAGTTPSGGSSSTASSGARVLDISSNAAFGLTGVLAAMIGLL